jgi:hypothetical protein
LEHIEITVFDMKASMESMDDDDLLSERMQRFLQTFPLDEDHDDEYVLLNTGQIVRTKQLQHHAGSYQEPVTPASTSGRTPWNYLCLNSDRHNSSSVLNEQLNKLLCAPIYYATNSSCFVFLYLIVTLVFVVGLYLNRHRYSSTAISKTIHGPIKWILSTSREVLESSCSRRLNKTDLSARSAVKNEQQQQQQRAILSDVDSKRSARDIPSENDENSVPDLIVEQTEDMNRVLTTKSQNTTVATLEARQEMAFIAPEKTENSEHVITVPGPIRTTIDDARQALALVSMYEQACAEQGRVCDDRAALLWAAQQQKADKILNARRDEELRRYLWDNSQRTVDRSLSQQQHDEKLAAGREDKDWQSKLVSCRDKCHSALIRSFYHCFVGTFLIVVSRPIILLVRLWSTLSTTEMVCYGTGTSFDPKVVTSVSSAWYGRYNSYNYVDSWTSAVLGEAATCLTYAIGRVFYVAAALIALNAASWLLRQMAIAEYMQNFVKAAVLLLILSICGWIPEYHLYRLVFCLGVIASATYFVVNLQFQNVRKNFRRMNTPPQLSLVSQCLEWFDDAVGIIEMIPIVAVGGLIFVLVS